MLKRNAANFITDWIDNKSDALLVTGARQIGKTYTIRECLKKSGHQYIEFNFIDRPELISLFANASSADDLSMRISVAAGKPLMPGDTIIFLDEVQEFKDIITRIKFLTEQSSFRYICSGSLLGVELQDLRSAPVGYMEILDMYPLNLSEFYTALGIQDDTLDMINKRFLSRTPVDEYINKKLIDAFYLYLIVGGMPEAVQVYIDTNDIARVSSVHEKIRRLYKQDFTKYEHNYKLKLSEIYEAIPSELNEKNKRFCINHIAGKTNFSRVSNDFLWLKDAGVALPVYNVTEPQSPLLVNEKRSLFKLFMSDVGLLTSCYPQNVKFMILNQDSEINNGSLFENAVIQELVSHGIKPYYFNSKSQGEIDALIELDGHVLPIEVKSGKDYEKHSAINNILADKGYDIPTGYVLGNTNIELDGKILYLPIYMISCFHETQVKDSHYKIDLSGL